MSNPILGLPQSTADLGSSITSKAGANADQPDFLDTLRTAVEQVNDLQGQADTSVAGLVGGDGQDVHSAMIAVEKADLAFELMVQVRNKIVSAYQEVSRMSF